MKLPHKKYHAIFFFHLILCSLTSLSQSPAVKATSDRKEILIGEQFKVTVEAAFNKDQFTTTGFFIPDSIAHFEIINKGKLEAVYSKNQLAGFTQIITFTSFDSGKWVIPSLKVIFNPGSKQPKTLFSDSLPITVSYSLADTSNTVRDIKPISEVETNVPIWYWLIAGITLLFLILAGIWYFKYRKKIKNMTAQPLLPPYEQAMNALENLKQYNLTEVQQVVLYHSNLKSIFKRYLSRKDNSSFQNKTTADLLLFIKPKLNEKEIYSNAAFCLRCCDAVQFAKYFPAEQDSIKNLLVIKEMIDKLENIKN
jgi:hypothetical protein